MVLRQGEDVLIHKTDVPIHKPRCCGDIKQQYQEATSHLRAQHFQHFLSLLFLTSPVFQSLFCINISATTAYHYYYSRAIMVGFQYYCLCVGMDANMTIDVPIPT